MKDKKNIMIVLLLLLFTSLSIGYVFLGLNMNSGTVLNSLQFKWDIKMNNITSIETVGNARSINTLLNGGVAYFEYATIGSDDKVIYTINIENNGNFDAKLNEIVVSGIDNYIIDGINAGVVIKSGESRLFTLSVNGKNSNSIDEIHENIVKFKLILDFVQN